MLNTPVVVAVGAAGAFFARDSQDLSGPHLGNEESAEWDCAWPSSAMALDLYRLQVEQGLALCYARIPHYGTRVGFPALLLTSDPGR